MNSLELTELWSALPTPADATSLSARALPDEGAWVAIDHLGQRHLLLVVPEGAEEPATSTRGLRLTVAQHQVADEPPAVFADLVCLSPDAAPTFAAVAADIGRVVGPVEPARRMNALADALARWRWFWGVEQDSLSESDAVGLFGELWFLLRWEGPTRATISSWNVGDHARHDFQASTRSVEVKTTARRADGAVVHRIQHLDQLADPEAGRLFLFSLRLVRDELARNTLSQLVEAVVAGLGTDVESKDELFRKLAARGYSPAHRHLHDVPYRVLGEIAYSVVDKFPRLTPGSFDSGLPSGIAEVSYLLDMAACDEWIVATSPAEWAEMGGSDG